MEIRINTANDSAEDIRKIIQFLQKFVDDGQEPAVSEGIFNFLDSNAESPASDTAGQGMNYGEDYSGSEISEKKEAGDESIVQDLPEDKIDILPYD